MKEALPYIFFCGMGIALVAAMASLGTPRAAIFFRRKTRLRGIFSWLAIAFVCFTCIGVFAPKDTRNAAVIEQKAGATPVDTASVAPASAEALATVEHSSPATNLHKSKDEDFGIFAYRVSQSIPRTTRHGRVDGGLIYIYPSQPDIELTNESIGTTCQSASKFFINEYSKKYGDIDNMLVVITDAPYDINKYNNEIYYNRIGKLAECHYLYTKQNGWKSIKLEASPRNTTPTEKQIEDLWFKLHNKYKHENRISDYNLKEEIGKKLNINPDDINFTPVPPEKMNPKQFKNIYPQGPAEQQ